MATVLTCVCVNVPMARWGRCEMSSNSGQHANAAELRTVTPNAPVHLLKAVHERQQNKRGRGRVETKGTRGESLRQWVKEREWCGMVLQKVRIIREVSCYTSQQLIPEGTREANCVGLLLCCFICFTRTSFGQRRISCWSTAQSFEMEGRRRVKQR